MQHTSNYNLKKPEGNDYAKIQALNDNAEIIDAEIKELADTKYTKPVEGIPKSDLAGPVQASLDKADNAATQEVLGELFIQAGQIMTTVNDLTNGLTQHKDDNAHIKISVQAPTNLPVGNLWFDLGETSDVGGGGEGAFVFGNGIVSDGEPGDKTAIWLDYKE